MKKIAVKAIEQTGDNRDTRLSIQEIFHKTGSPQQKIEFEVKTQSGVKRKLKVWWKNPWLYAESGIYLLIKEWP